MPANFSIEQICSSISLSSSPLLEINCEKIPFVSIWTSYRSGTDFYLETISLTYGIPETGAAMILFTDSRSIFHFFLYYTTNLLRKMSYSSHGIKVLGLATWTTLKCTILFWKVFIFMILLDQSLMIGWRKNSWNPERL